MRFYESRKSNKSDSSGIIITLIEKYFSWLQSRQIEDQNLLNGGWNTWLIDKKKIRVNFQMFQEHAHPAFLINL